MGNEEMERQGQGTLHCKWGVIKQDSRVYMMCKVAQVFHARGCRSIVLFASPFSGKESGYNYADKVCAHTPVLLAVLLLILVILLELPHLAYNTAASVISLIDSECVCRFYTYVSLGHNKRVE